jgi:hypothetical protein
MSVELVGRELRDRVQRRDWHLAVEVDPVSNRSTLQDSAAELDVAALVRCSRHPGGHNSVEHARRSNGDGRG